jgi:hypothetical protein
MKKELAKVGVICLLDNILKPYLIIGNDCFNKEDDIIVIDSDMKILQVNHNRLS